MTRSHRSRCGITLADNFFMGAFGGSYLNHFCSSVRARRNIRTLTRARRRARFQRSSYFSWPSLVMTGGLLAPLAAVVLQRQDFTALPGISVIVGCLVINSAAYGVAIWLKTGIIYLKREPTTYHTMVATIASIASTSGTKTLSPTHGRATSCRGLSSRFTELSCTTGMM
jgi:hypothetical protein